MDDAAASRHPLQIAVTVTSCIPSRVCVVNQSFHRGSNRFKSSVGVLKNGFRYQLNCVLILLQPGLGAYLGKTWNSIAMIHTVRRTGIKVRPISSSGSLHFLVTSRIMILVVDTKQERIQSLERARRKWLNAGNRAF